MRRLTPPADGWPATLWFAWAVSILPVMIILPPYVFPLPAGPPLNVFDGRRVLEILWAAGLVAALLSPTIRSASIRIWSALSTTTRVTVCLLATWALLSALLSYAPGYSLREWSLGILLLVSILPLAALAGPGRKKVLELLGLTLVLYAVVTFPSPLDHGFHHPRFLGQVIAVATPALLFSGNPVLALMAAPALGLGIVNGSRALLLTMVVVSLAALVIWPDRRRRMLPGLLGLAGAGVVVAVLVGLGYDSSLQEAVQRGTTLTGRGALWRDALDRFLAAPLLGEGPGMLAGGGGMLGWAGHPHNSVLLIAAETGIVGLVAATVLAATLLRRLATFTSDRRPWGLALVAGLFHSLLSGTILMPASQALLVLALALVLPGPRADRPVRHGTAWALGAVGAVALVILLATFSLPSADDRYLLAPRFRSSGPIP